MLLFWLLVAVNTGVMCWSPVCDLVLRTFMVEEEWTVVVLNAELRQGCVVLFCLVLNQRHSS